MKRIISMLTVALVMAAMLVAGVAGPAWASYSNNNVHQQNNQHVVNSYGVDQQGCNFNKTFAFSNKCSQY